MFRVVLGKGRFLQLSPNGTPGSVRIRKGRVAQRAVAPPFLATGGAQTTHSSKRNARFGRNLHSGTIRSYSGNMRRLRRPLLMDHACRIRRVLMFSSLVLTNGNAAGEGLTIPRRPATRSVPPSSKRTQGCARRRFTRSACTATPGCCRASRNWSRPTQHHCFAKLPWPTAAFERKKRCRLSWWD